MNILLVPNAMKGALSAQKISAILQNTLLRKFPHANIVSVPIADGGNGTLDSLINNRNGTIEEKEVTGPIPTTQVTARFGITKNGIGIIESAEAIGLHLITPSPETIAQSTTYGVGELLLNLYQRQCKEIWIGLGGSATNDAGAGMIKAFGMNLLNKDQSEILDGALNLIHLNSIISDKNQMRDVKVKVLSDVTNPLLGPDGATYTYAKQKGATEEQLPYLEAAIKNFANVVEAHKEKSLRFIAGGGAAGGLGFGLLAFCNAELVSGVDFILDAASFNEKLATCDLVITSEGKLDKQTMFGKGIYGITERAKKYAKPVHAFVGRIHGDEKQLQETLGIASITQISPDDMTTTEALRDASWLLADAVYHHKF